MSKSTLFDVKKGPILSTMLSGSLQCPNKMLVFIYLNMMQCEQINVSINDLKYPDIFEAHFHLEIDNCSINCWIIVIIVNNF